MRTAILALSAALTLATGWLRTDRSGEATVDAGLGRVAWFDLTTGDLAGSKAFYGGLFGWEFGPVAGTDLAFEISAGGTAIGTLRNAEGELSAFNGVVYVQVEDIRASCDRATELGGTIAPGFPFDIPDGAGAIALLLDPAGHPVGMYSPTPLASASTPK